MIPDVGTPAADHSDARSAEAVAARVLDILATVTETAEVRAQPDLELYETGVLDSLRTVELIVALSEALGVDLAPSEFERHEWATPRRLVACMQRRVSG